MRGSNSGSAALVPRAMPQADGAKGERGLRKVGWVPPQHLEYQAWVEAGRYLGALGRGSQWWIGDWIRYGAAKWGQKYTQAARITGYDIQSLRNMAYVASRFDLSRRRDKLTWSHHAELAALDLKEQDEWLDRAAKLKLSAGDLRVELRDSRRQVVSKRDEAEDEASPAAGDTDTGFICPNCGFKAQALPASQLAS